MVLLAVLVLEVDLALEVVLVLDFAFVLEVDFALVLEVDLAFVVDLLDPVLFPFLVDLFAIFISPKFNFPL